ncbi:5'-nucleotidase C-terminal domain-containing protein [Falsirhodobacter halotolerans]|uniref:5'-nucleotidase C-terminal domain-containing protein n=1 Tax=Falsirhodobacter halotolerans TaxID=1146892 RepID=UPI001FD3AA89|nr:5'-nucleotidase C-terminal domain-containing protein [Falsirhodobacter halotolerans]MCJ8140402.1 5'-nucleotidase C-terminal domain-containing protein [Falsirhodobacter halotolerans]
MLPAPFAPDPAYVDLRILATSDIHGWIGPWDYHAAQPTGAGGLARIATLIGQARSAHPNVVLFDNGDFLQGTPLTDPVPGRGGHPAVRAMNHLRYDAVTLGNHEFNFGLDAMRAAIAGADFPVVSANIATPEGEAIVPHWTVLARQVTDGAGRARQLRIGVIGLLPTQVMIWDRALLDGRMRADDLVATLRRHMPALRAACDLVVVLAHAGIGAPDACGMSEDAATALAAVEGVDAVVAGHSHLVFPSPAFAGMAGVDVAQGTLQGVPSVMPGSCGSHLGVIDLRLSADLRVVAHQSTAVEVRGHVPCPALTAVIDADHRATRAAMDRVIGHSAHPLNSFFSVIAPSPINALIARASAAHVARRIGGEVPVLGVGQIFRAGGRGGPGFFTDIPAGPVLMRHIADLYSFPNAIAALRVTGSELKGWLERAVSVFAQVRAGGADQPLLNPDCPLYNFDIVHGVTFGVDLSRAPGGGDRIVDLRHDGRPVAPDAPFVLATNSYRAGGAGGFAPRPPFWTDGAMMRDVVADHIARHGVPPAEADWRFLPMPGASVVFPTSPKADAHRHEVPGLALTSLGLDADGFLAMRLSL